MKKITWQAPLLLMLIFVLSIGLSYLVLNENKVSELDGESLRMSIALVNEDDGGYFNDEKIVFGDEFSNSVIKNNKHDWYVVSRGVAESGYERNSYDMMIVIPNDFSENSLSINEESPEKVVLNYKINATGHEEVRAEAEKVAGKILNDFNRRLIDVYFASIIGNLQDAQDNVTEIIEQEEQLANLYVDHIKSPLTNYTSDFSNIQSYANTSKHSYAEMENTLNTFESDLIDDVNNKSAYLLDLDEAINRKEDAGNISNVFADSLNEYARKQMSDDVLDQLNRLKQENNHVHEQFVVTDEEENSGTIISQTKVLESYFTDLNDKVLDFSSSLNEKIDVNLEKIFDETISAFFNDEFGEERNVFIGELLGTTVEEMIKRNIAEAIKVLPTLNADEINKSGLSEYVIRDINNVITVTNKYHKEHEISYDPELNKDKLFSNQIEELKKALVTEGVIAEDSVEVFPYESEDQYLYLSVQNFYNIEGVWLTIDGEKRHFTTNQDDENALEYEEYEEYRRVKIPLNEYYIFDTHKRLHVKVHFKLDGSDKLEQIDIFSPLVWEWNVAQEGMEEMQEDKNDLFRVNDDSYVSNEIIQPLLSLDNENEMISCLDILDAESSEDCIDDEQSNEICNENDELCNEEEICLDNDSENVDDKCDDIGKGDGEEEKDSNCVDVVENDAEGEIDNCDNNGDEDNIEIIIERILMNNYYMNQKVHSKLMKDTSTELLQAIPDMVIDYYRLLSLYEVYYGLDMKSDSLKETVDVDGVSLSSLAKDNSLYSLFHTQGIKSILEEFIFDTVKTNVINDIQISYGLEDLANRVNVYEDLLMDTQNSSDRLANIIADTSGEAIKLNENIQSLLGELTVWRESSESLVSDQTKIMEHNQDVTSAVMNLDVNYQSLLLASENLADKAQVNANSADTVYQTFEQIYEEADSIQDSGITLVNQATDLANKLTDKTLDDLSFANNFSKVLENSRIGDRQNEKLYDFLSSPVETKNNGLIKEGESFIAYFLVVIMAVLSIFTAYAISTIKLKTIKEEVFDVEKTIFKRNMPLALVTLGIGIIEGIVIGLVSSYLLSINHPVLWMLTITLLMISMVLISTYLIRQLKMVGMFILLTILSLYLFITKTLGFSFKYSGVVNDLRLVSPLQHVETLITNMLDNTQGSESLIVGITLIMLVAAVGGLLNFVVFKRKIQTQGTEEVHVEAS